MSSKFRTVYIPFVLVFLSGALVGGFAHRLYMMNTVKADNRSGPEEYRRRYVEEMQTRLALTQDQLSKLNKILDGTREKFRVLREQHRPEMKVIQDEQVMQVNAILSESQRPEYAKLREERERKRQERERLEKEKAAESRR